MDELIATIAQRFGIDPGMARTIVGKLLELARDRLGGGAGSELLARIPGADGAVDSAQGASGGGGLMGMASKLGSVFGGSGGAAAGLTATAKESGLDMGQLGELAGMLVDYAGDKAGPDTAAQLRGALPLDDLLKGR